MRTLSLAALLAVATLAAASCGPDTTEAAPAKTHEGAAAPAAAEPSPGAPAAKDLPGRPVADDPSAAGKGKKSGDEPAPTGDPSGFSATVEDKFGVKVDVTKGGLYYQSGGFLFSGEGQLEKSFIVQHGAGTIEVPLADIDSAEFSRVDDKDLVGVKLTLKGGKPPLEAKIKKSTELRGDTPYGKFKIKLQDVKSIKFVG